MNLFNKRPAPERPSASPSLPKRIQRSFAHDQYAEVIDPESKKVTGWTCKHCGNGRTFSVSNITNFKYHLLNSKVCPFLRSAAAKQCTDKEVIAALENEGLVSSSSAPTERMAPCSVNSSGSGSVRDVNAPSGLPGVSKGMLQSTLDTHVRKKLHLNKEETNKLAELIADMVYTTNLPFKWIESPKVQALFQCFPCPPHGCWPTRCLWLPTTR